MTAVEPLPAPDAELEPGTESNPDDRFRTLTVTVDREDAWLYECARMIVRRVSGGRTADKVVEALIGEGTSSLVPHIPEGAIRPSYDDPSVGAQRAWEAQLAAYREEAEALCEARIRGRAPPDAVTGRREPRDDSAIGLDTWLIRVAGELAERDVAIGRLAEMFWKADGWRRLGYATEPQYARERLGLSLTAVKAKRRLARKLGHLPDLDRAVSERRLGYEAARLVSGVATPDTVRAWVERAERRTVKLLREEIDGAGMVSRLMSDDAPAPPPEEFMEALEALETHVMSGAAFADAARVCDDGSASGVAATDGAGTSGVAAIERASFTRGDPAADVVRSVARAAGALAAAWHAGQKSAACRAEGRVTLRLRVREGTYGYYRWLERMHQRFRPEKIGFLRFLCVSLIDAWKHALPPRVAYGHIYARERFRCLCPVCTRGDDQPHHLKPRSRGGGEEDDNLAGICTWCHLEGVHGGRLHAEPPARCITWRIGRVPHTIVVGRERIRMRA
jgi:hypothetical protein